MDDTIMYVGFLVVFFIICVIESNRKPRRRAMSKLTSRTRDGMIGTSNTDSKETP